MDVKQYYRKMREVESTLSESYPVVISVETADGGKAGVLAEVSRPVAAKMIVEGRAVLATAAEKEQFFEQQALAIKTAEKAEIGRRLQVAIISDSELKTAIASKKTVEPTGK